ncbi:MAG: division/cell wall cluster transcriptional repressor MraZ [Anaerolineae bacterium]|nr:division/cell wall cluster transcriptional repressor MraZ [Anaerolineae bacterium]
MFLGQYEHSIDEKGRVTIPARYRDLLEDGAYITLGFDQNLIVMTPAIFEKMSLRLSQMNMADPTARQLKRLIFSNAEKVEVDKAGRILIPAFLRQPVQLEVSAMVVGTGSYFEIWSPELWKKQSEPLADAESNQQRFALLDLSI